MTSSFDPTVFNGFDHDHAVSEWAELSISASRFNVHLTMGDRITQEFLARDADRQVMTKQYNSVSDLVQYAARHGIGYLHVMQIRREEFNDSGYKTVSKFVSFAI